MNRLTSLFGIPLIAAGLGVVGCSAAPEQADGSGDNQVAAEQDAFQNSLSFVNCGQTQQTTIHSFADMLSNRIYENQGASMRACLSDSFLSYVNGAEWSGDIWKEYNRAATTQITCANSLTTCGGSLDTWGCANVGISGEVVTLMNQMINDPNVSTQEKASLLAHELSHNYGHSHPNSADNDSEYFFTVPERARSCVRNFNSLPFGESRTNGMPGEVELGYVGRFGGTPYEFAGTGSQFVSGINSWANATINGLEVQMSDVSENRFFEPLVGTQNGFHNTNRLCNSGEVVIGLWGTAGSTVNQMAIRCAQRTNLGNFHDLPADGNANNQMPYSTMCPAGKAVRQIRGRSGSSIDQIKLVCDDVNKAFSPDHAPHKVGPMFGSASGVLFSLRCSGNGAFSSFNGRSGSLVDRLAGMCTPTGGTLPVTPQGPVHPAIPWMGGHGGTAFANACPGGELMVGVNVRSGSSVNAVGPICAPASQWDTSATGAHDLALNGGTGGTLNRQMCPAFQFLVGLEAWGGSVVNGVQAVCADMR